VFDVPKDLSVWKAAMSMGGLYSER
jgi:hypothetical protein